MSTIITLSSLGLTLALSGAALATPANRSVFLDERTGFAKEQKEQLQNYYRHKRYYRHEQDRARGDGLLQDRRSLDGVGAARPALPTPAIRPEPTVLREPVVRERPL
jgi:hypothetical protein